MIDFFLQYHFVIFLKIIDSIVLTFDFYMPYSSLLPAELELTSAVEKHVDDYSWRTFTDPSLRALQFSWSNRKRMHSLRQEIVR